MILYLRKFEVVETIDLAQDWTIEVRKRLSGKLAGNTYKVFIAPDKNKFYSLAKARANGFAATDYVDGRSKKATKAKKALKKLKSKSSKDKGRKWY